MKVAHNPSLFREIFDEPVIREPAPGFGRHPELHQKRNECLVDRVYFIGKATKMKYQALIALVAGHFFISPVMAQKVFLANSDYLKTVRASLEGLDLKAIQLHFKRKWSHLNWDDVDGWISQ